MPSVNTSDMTVKAGQHANSNPTNAGQTYKPKLSTLNRSRCGVYCLALEGQRASQHENITVLHTTMSTTVTYGSYFSYLAAEGISYNSLFTTYMYIYIAYQ